MNKIQIVGVISALFIVTHCGGPAGTGSGTVARDNNLNLTVNNTAASESLAPPAGKAVSSDVSAAVVSTGSVRCVSVDSDGKKTTTTGTLNESGQATCSGIPSNQETICYLLDASGVVTATLPITDTGAMGNIRDGFKMGGGKAVDATITYNSNSPYAVF